LDLPQAREEGKHVVEILRQARQAWRGEYDIRVTVRIGPRGGDGSADSFLSDLRDQSDFVESADTCDPLELAMLIMTEQYDVIHYAGHGLFDRKNSRAGWVFSEECFLTANEIFRVRQVP